ncbi:MAG: hypothetical protein BWY42_00828 [Candidatus Omnitrophica bacterium ADurb.Bin277]|nr:MAG: hypothetical protein BWY42_00828 [Candidatus Omnitrophica bacterium ADurb.Bin277]
MASVENDPFQFPDPAIKVLAEHFPSRLNSLVRIRSRGILKRSQNNIHRLRKARRIRFFKIDEKFSIFFRRLQKHFFYIVESLHVACGQLGIDLFNDYQRSVFIDNKVVGNKPRRPRLCRPRPLEHPGSVAPPKVPVVIPFGIFPSFTKQLLVFLINVLFGHQISRQEESSPDQNKTGHQPHA